MAFDGYKSCRILRKQVLSTELNIRYMNTRYLSVIITIPVADRECLAHSYIPGSSRVGHNFIFHKYAD